MDEVGGKSEGDECLAHDANDCLIRFLCCTSTAQDHGIASFQGEHGGVDRDVRAGLVDHADDSHRHAKLGDAQPQFVACAADDFPDGVRQGFDLTD